MIVKHEQALGTSASTRSELLSATISHHDSAIDAENLSRDVTRFR